MTYHLELLGDDGFQKLCQALMILQSPNAQCMPIGQPDGGRDGFAQYWSETGLQNQDIYQVKFVKDPATKKSREFIESVIKSEAPKVKKLVAIGAKSYHLMTNVAGTGHLDAGTIDKVNAELSRTFSIPSYCWWRDDIERRIDASTSVKWSFPEILKATDVFSLLLQAGGNELEIARSEVIRSYLAHQFHNDSQLKFKQIELNRSIFDLFVDVPGRVSPSPGMPEQDYEIYWGDLIESCGVTPLNGGDDHFSDPPVVGVLELLTKRKFERESRKLVVEGAPGQGKSTVTQYLCQIYRALLLNRKFEYGKIEQKHRPESACIPFRVDLRDYASWLAGRDPFSDDPAEPLPTNSTPVLENFIATQVHRSTGANFTVQDLTAISRRSRVLIVLDGFDEVADTKLRNRIVSEVTSASERISINAISAQIIVTSRPAAFANSPGFPRDSWQHLQILPLTKLVIYQCAEKWLSNKASDQRERQAVITLLKEKLKQSHVRDLARNPMQLTILLALISVQGASLPDKRTALYDNYIQIFLNRESEKSSIVRDHRQLLIQIHRYLAWKLHAEAERSGSGNISEAALRISVREFLEANGHDVALAEKLFGGMVERVVALVSRVQGTFEFEVQPLREYFAARHLYDTAPYIQAGTASKAALPQRFTALARNFYWLNVTRFYAGCYSSGELSSLIDGVEELGSSFEFNRIGYPSQLALTLVNDYVFSEHPKLESRLVKRVVENNSLIMFLAEEHYKRRAEPLVIGSAAGRASLSHIAKTLLKELPMTDQMSAVARILAQNDSFDDRVAFWHEMRAAGLSSRRWIALGMSLGVLSLLDVEEAEKLVEEFGAEALNRFTTMNRTDIFERNPNLWRGLLDNVVSGRSFIMNEQIQPLSESGQAFCELIVAIGMILWPYFLNSLDAQQTRELTMRGALSRHFLSGRNRLSQSSEDLLTTPEHDLMGVVTALNKILVQPVSVFVVDGKSWFEFIDATLNLWGDQWPLISAAINYVDRFSSPAPEHFDLAEVDIAFSQRALVAKSRTDDTEWWGKQLGDFPNSNKINQLFFLACFFRWAPAQMIVSRSELLSRALEDSSAETWNSLYQSMQWTGYDESRQAPDRADLKHSDFSTDMSPRLAALLLHRVSKPSVSVIWGKYLKPYNGTDAEIWNLGVSFALSSVKDADFSWEDMVMYVKTAYRNGVSHLFREATGVIDPLVIPNSIARKICEDCWSLPLGFVGAASVSLTHAAGAVAVPVMSVAVNDSWFAQE